MFSPHTGSVRPSCKAITGLSCDGRKAAIALSRPPIVLALASRTKSRVSRAPKRSGIWLMDSVPPAITSSAWPVWIWSAAAVRDCMPEAQLRWTV